MAERVQLEHTNAEDSDANIEASVYTAQRAFLQVASQESARRKSDQASLTQQQPHGPSSDSADSSASFALSFRSLSSAAFLGAASEEKIDARGGLESATDSSVADPPFATAAVNQVAAASSGAYQSLEAAVSAVSTGGHSAVAGRAPPRGSDSVRRSEQSQSFFPSKLYNLLLDAEAEGLDHIVSFTANGAAFRIHDPQEFIRVIVPRYFKQKKLDSFKRQLLLYGFDRIPRGPEEGAYAHKFFLRGRPELTKKIKRLKQSEKMTRGNWEPDFTSP